jgi:hypothetical protein
MSVDGLSMQWLGIHRSRTACRSRRPEAQLARPAQGAFLMAPDSFVERLLYDAFWLGFEVMASNMPVQC